MGRRGKARQKCAPRRLSLSLSLSLSVRARTNVLLSQELWGDVTVSAVRFVAATRLTSSNPTHEHQL